MTESGKQIFKKSDIFLFLALLYLGPSLIQLCVFYILRGNYFLAMFPPKITDIPPFLWSMFVSQTVLMFVCLWLLKKKYKLDDIRLGFVSRGFVNNIILPILVVFASLLIIAIFGLLIEIFGITIPETPMSEVTKNIFKAADPSQVFLLIFVGVILGPIAEEIIFRVYLYSAFKKHANVLIAVIFSSAIFALSHYRLMLMPFFFILGVIFAVIYDKTKSIIPCIVTHSLYNLLMFLFGYAALQPSLEIYKFCGII